MQRASTPHTLKKFAIRAGIALYWILFVNQPLYVCWLWKFWWIRPVIIWYLPLTIFLLFNYVCFATCSLYCFLTGGGKTSAFRPALMKFQLFCVYIFLRLTHGNEIHGLRNLPKGGGLIVYFHGPLLPVDAVYLFTRVYLETGRMIGGVIDFKVHYNSCLGQCFEFYEFSSSRETLIDDLKEGKLRSVAPGGAYEAMFSENNRLEWRSRSGFARVAKETGVPIIPMFTTNLQLATPLIDFIRSETMRRWYALTRSPLLIPRYYAPVKMRTYLGEPLHCGEDEEPETFAQRVKEAIENLRDQNLPHHQSVWGALLERFS